MRLLLVPNQSVSPSAVKELFHPASAAGAGRGAGSGFQVAPPSVVRPIPQEPLSGSPMKMPLLASKKWIALTKGVIVATLVRCHVPPEFVVR